MNKCVEICENFYEKYRNEIEENVCMESTKLKLLLKSEVIDYLCIMLRLKYVRNQYPGKGNTTYQKLVNNIMLFINEVDGSEDFSGASDHPAIYKLVKESFAQWQLDIGCSDDFGLLDKNSKRDSLTDVPTIILNCAIMLYLLDRHYKKKRINISNDEEWKLGNKRKKTIAEQYENNYIIYQKFVDRFCPEDKDIAWYSFERHYNLAFWEQYLLDENKDNDENWRLSIGHQLPIPNNYLLTRELFSILNNRKTKYRVITVGSVEAKLNDVGRKIENIVSEKCEIENDINNSTGRRKKLLGNYLKEYEKDLDKKKQEKSFLLQEFKNKEVEKNLKNLRNIITYIADTLNIIKNESVFCEPLKMDLAKYTVKNYIFASKLNFKQYVFEFNNIHEKVKHDRKKIELGKFERKKLEESLIEKFTNNKL